MTNPFSYGNPISEPENFFGRQNEVRQVFSRLKNAEFESSSLVGVRRIGKTSLLNYLLHEQTRRNYGLDLENYLFVYLDLSLIDRSITRLQLWQQILKQIASHCQASEDRQAIEGLRNSEQIDNFALKELFSELDHRGKYIVLLLDEFENVTENPNFGPDFFFGLRSLATHNHLALITSSRSELIKLCHSKAISSSPFFNIFANINLRLFTREEAQQLIDNSLANTNVNFSEAEVEKILQIGGLHPYFLKVACSFMFEAYRRNLDAERRLEFVSRQFWQEATPHLEYCWSNLDDAEQIVLTALALLERQGKVGDRSFSVKRLKDLYEHSSVQLMNLEKYGLVVAQNDTYCLFNTSFEDWIAQEVLNSKPDQIEYKAWLESNQGLIESLSRASQREVKEILPKISEKYRKKVVQWMGDPKNLLAIAQLLRKITGF